MSKQREMIYLDELITEIRKNREIGKNMRNAMIEIAKSCKREQKEEMSHFKQIRREEVMSKLEEGKNIYCVALNEKEWKTGIYQMQFQQLARILCMIEVENAVFYERIEEGEI